MAKGPAGDAFYTPPSPIPGHAHGDVIYFRPAEANNYTTLAGASRNWLLLYRSHGVAGSPVADSGMIAFPRGRAPKGGWPVLAWAHGTTGLADKCAPTRLPRTTDPYSSELRTQLSSYVKAGYAVVSAD